MTASAERSLLEEARRAAVHAHAPYSRFRVGAAVLGAGGEIVRGCNVESASYGLSCCAERVALFAAVSQGVRPVRLAVACVDAPEGADPVNLTPCGACRQIALDQMGRDAIVDIDRVGSKTVGELLFLGFELPGARA